MTSAATIWETVPPHRLASRLSRATRAFLIDAGLVGLLALLPWLYFWRLFAPNRADQMTLGEGDFMGNSFPLLLTVARALRDGALPLWNPLSGGGQPLLAHPQAGVLYPLNWLVLPSIQGLDASSLLALERTLPLHIALASVGTYALGRMLIGSRVGSLIAAITFGYSGFLTSYPLQQLPILRSTAWFPWQVLTWWLAMERRSLAWAAATGILFAVAFLAGHPQTVFIESVGIAVITAGWSAARLAPRESPSLPGGEREIEGRLTWPSRHAVGSVVRIWLLAIPLVLVGAGLSAVQWLPTRELQALSSRTDEGYNFVAAGFSLWEVPFDLIAPGVLGGLPPYMGILPLVLAAGGMIVGATRLHVPLVALGVTGLLVAFGGQTFLYPALYVMFPGFDLFRNQERAIFLCTLSVALLAGLGAASLLGPLDLHARGRLLRFQRVLRVLLALGIVVGAALYVGHISAEVANQGFRRWRDVVHSFFFFLFVFASAWGLVGARLTVPSLLPALPVLMVLLVSLDLFSVSADKQFIVRPPDTAFHRPLVVDRIWPDIEYGKLADRNILSGNHGLIYELASVTSTFPLRLARMETARQRLPESRFFDLLNVTHLVAPRDDPQLREPGRQEALPDAGYVLFRRGTAPGPALIVAEARAVGSAEEALRAVVAPEFDPRSQVVIEQTNGDPLPRGGPGTIREFKKGWSETTLRASAATGGYLVLNDVAYPGWRVLVDGVEQHILRANYLTQAVQLVPGEHAVTFRYEPDSVRFGALISGVTVLGLILLAAWTLIAGPSRQERPRS